MGLFGGHVSSRWHAHYLPPEPPPEVLQSIQGVNNEASMMLLNDLPDVKKCHALVVTAKTVLATALALNIVQ